MDTLSPLPQRVLITGASGFLGSRLTDQAAREGLSVVALSRRTPRLLPARAEHRPGDLADLEGLTRAMEGVDAVIHAAGLAHVRETSRRAPFEAVNAEGSANVARAAVAAAVPHIVHVSSVSVYGNGPGGPCGEGTPCRPETGYASSKLRGEQEAVSITASSSTAVTILRLATVYGEGDPGNIGRLMRAIDRGRFVWVGTGANRKTVIHRDDAARACVVALRRPGRGAAVYNVCGRPCTVRELVDHLTAALGRSVPRWHVSARLCLGMTAVLGRLTGARGAAGDLHASLVKFLREDLYDGRRFEQDFAFTPEVALAEGITREVSAYRNGLGQAG